ncbi:DUF4833 domain-containing protein [Carboxylicivirga sp. A043]|uniref:DUF4833 domain-containing protein n=1 Tax=Carboxylicivirga litoralis TaxID=2816963 RepID=UPI0021CB1019|nr:DUF4833 domain-containing protein [Carboxylicivirga sp. A043]MCU4156122.1 DUF4833 domain-containing protein [Carboxylicivirga sp. A043]
MKILFIQLLLILNFKAVTSYPIPEKKPELLFYIQRSTNTNTVIYEANFNEKGWLDPKKPVNIYWLMYEEGKKTEDLSFFEKHYAFGVKTKPCENDSNTYWLRLVSQKQLPVKLVQTEPFKVSALIQKNDNTYLFDHIFITSDESGLWPEVESIELFMHSLDRSTTISEFIKLD